MKLALCMALSFLAVTAHAEEKRFCGKITHITLHQYNGGSSYNFGMAYSVISSTNSFGWLDPKDAKQKEILELVKYAKAHDLTFCSKFDMLNDAHISVQ